MRRFKDFLKDHANMAGYLDHEGAALSIRKNIEFKGPTVFILACAIIIASVGLNVNSIPVIIGAMLISPVMGPIIGFGFGLGTRDNRLVKDSLENFAVMVVISILVSTLYFIITPLKLENPSELLARTNPTIYDVFIALFGGIAGMLETSRKEKGTVLSGVAIATALMPPLCTVGYGLSLLNWRYVSGALYLFIINSIFIALATYLTVKYLRYPSVAEGSSSRQRITTRSMAFLLLLIIVPSVISAVRIVQENNFQTHAERVVARNKSLDKGFIYDYKVNSTSNPRTLELYMAGESLSAVAREKLYADAEAYGITRSQIIFHEDAAMTRDILSESDVIKSIYEHSDRQIQTLTDSIASLESSLKEYREKDFPTAQISKELFAQYPSVTGLTLTVGNSVEAGKENEPEERTVAVVYSKEALDSEMIARIERWLEARLQSDGVTVLNSY